MPRMTGIVAARCDLPRPSGQLCELCERAVYARGGGQTAPAAGAVKLPPSAVAWQSTRRLPVGLSADQAGAALPAALRVFDSRQVGQGRTGRPYRPSGPPRQKSGFDGDPSHFDPVCEVAIRTARSKRPVALPPTHPMHNLARPLCKEILIFQSACCGRT
eukprot:350229-Chlamydomonas_euryale.AAC.2